MMSAARVRTVQTSKISDYFIDSFVLYNLSSIKYISPSFPSIHISFLVLFVKLYKKTMFFNFSEDPEGVLRESICPSNRRRRWEDAAATQQQQQLKEPQERFYQPGRYNRSRFCGSSRSCRQRVPV
jgi:hypothetical protein